MDALRQALSTVIIEDDPAVPGAMLGLDWADAIIAQVGPMLLELARQDCPSCGRRCAICNATLSEIEAWSGDVCLLCGGEDALCRTPLTGPKPKPGLGAKAHH